MELDSDTLTSDEYQAFHDLSNVTSRFSEFEEDIKDNPGVYSTKEQVRQKIIETHQKLLKYFKEWHKAQIRQSLRNKPNE